MEPDDSINQLSQLALVVPLTKNVARLSPSHALIPKGVVHLSFASKAVTEQIKAVDKRRLDRASARANPSRDRLG